MSAALRCYALVSYFVHSVYSQDPAGIAFSRSTVFSGDQVALTCSYGSGVVLAFVTLDAYNGTHNVGFLRCSVASGNTTSFGVLAGGSFTGCPAFASGASSVSLTMRATPSLELDYNCSARVIDSNGNALTVTSLTASLVVLAAKHAECGTIVSGFGLLHSVNYPSSYINNHSCSWTLQASPPSGLLQLQFLAFATELNYDFVRIYNESGTLMFSYSGTSLPSSVTFRSQATVVFATDAFIVNTGFSIEVSTIAESVACGGLVKGFGLLQSVNYPNFYIDNNICSWTLQATPISGLLYLQFLTFATEPDYDFVRIYSPSGALMFSYAGTLLPPGLTLGSQATVIFATDARINDRGFSIAVSTVAARSQACGSLVSGFQLLESVNYPGSYVNSHNCPWTLRASPAGGLINLQFLAFSTESGHDFVRIYDQHGGLTASYSGTQLLPSLTLGSYATAIFTTDSYIVNKGFSIAVSTIAASSLPCGNLVNGSGLLQSVNYPTSYNNSHSCLWTLQTSPGGGFLYLDFQTFATEPNCDIVSIYNESGALVFSYSGTSLPPNLMLGSQATVTFTTDSSVVNTGFSIAVSTIGLALVTFSSNPVYVGELVTLTCSYGRGATLVIMTLDALYGTRKDGFLWCNVPQANTIGDGVFYGRSFIGCPSISADSTTASVTMVASQALELAYSCSAIVNDTSGGTLTLMSINASLEVLVLPTTPKFLPNPIVFNQSDNASIACESLDGKPAAVLKLRITAPSGREAIASDSSILLLPLPLVDWHNAVVMCSVTNHNFTNSTVSSRVAINYITVINMPSDVVATASNVALDCSTYISSYPGALYSWSLFPREANDTYGTVLTGATFTVPKGQTGLFYCTAWNNVTMENVTVVFNSTTRFSTQDNWNCELCWIIASAVGGVIIISVIIGIICKKVRSSHRETSAPTSPKENSGAVSSSLCSPTDNSKEATNVNSMPGNYEHSVNNVYHNGVSMDDYLKDDMYCVPANYEHSIDNDYDDGLSTVDNLKAGIHCVPTNDEHSIGNVYDDGFSVDDNLKAS